jgi:hypothetical protein
MDGDEHYMEGCSVFGKAGSGHDERLRRIYTDEPWALDDEQVRGLLLRVFPKWETDERQRTRAARWHTIILSYWRMGNVALQIAMRLKVPLKTVEEVIRRIRKAQAGLNTKGESRKRMGRPRKKSPGVASNL